MNQESPLITGAKGLNLVPPHIQRVVVATNSKFKAPLGWREAGGSMHYGRGLWLVPVERVTN